MQTLLPTLTLGAAQSTAINMLSAVLDGLNYLGLSDFFLTSKLLSGGITMFSGNLEDISVFPSFKTTWKYSFF